MPNPAKPTDQNAPTPPPSVPQSPTETAAAAATSGMSPAQLAEAIDYARRQEREAIEAKAREVETKSAKVQKDLKAAQDRLAELEALTNKDLSADEKMRKHVEAIRAELTREREERARMETEANARIARAELNQYRAQKMAEAGPNLVAGLVQGNTPEEIDRAIAVAQAEYQHIRQQSHAEFQAHLQAQGAHPTNQLPTAVGGSYSPHYAPPGQPNGFPSQNVNPAPVPPAQDYDLQSVRNLTSEQAIRSGAYAQHRAELHAALQNQSPQGAKSVGYNPRYMDQAPAPVAQPHTHMNLGNGTVSPNGLPHVSPRTRQVDPSTLAANQIGYQPGADVARLVEAARAKAGGQVGSAAQTYQQTFQNSVPSQNN